MQPDGGGDMLGLKSPPVSPRTITALEGPIVMKAPPGRFVLVFLAILAPRAAATSIELRDGDRVVLIGSTLVEREQDQGYIETVLTSRFPDRSITFRNLAWSGDTVAGEAQAFFGTPEDGYKHRLEHVVALKPTLIVIGYGANESFDGAAGLERFRTGLSRLLDDLASRTGARMVLLAPLDHEDLGGLLPSPAKHREALRLYRDAIREIAGGRRLGFIDLLAWHQDQTRAAPECPLTDNGIHPTPTGYARIGRYLAEAFGAPAQPVWKAVLTVDGRVESVEGAGIANLVKTGAGLRFEAAGSLLPPPSPPTGPCSGEPPGSPGMLEIRGLAPGRYVLKRDGEPIARFEANGSSRIAIEDEPGLRQVEQLRKAIQAKNTLYFYRWRPQNETYLFGFRKHEQGQNAREVPRFDPLVAEADSRIAVLRRPVSHTYVIEPEGDSR